MSSSGIALLTPALWAVVFGIILPSRMVLARTDSGWTSGSGFRNAPLQVPATGRPGFTELPAVSLGLNFTNALSPERVQAAQNLMNGAGLAAADVNGDGRVDLFFCHRQFTNQLFLNLGGRQFTNVTPSAGVACPHLISTGAVFGDVNGDGTPDLLITSFGGPHALLLNDGTGKFTDATAAAGIAGKSGSTSAALADLDGDGDLDLYWCNFGVQAILRDGGTITTRIINGQTQVTGRNANRVRIVDGMLYEYGDPDVLYLNDGQGHFRAVPWLEAFTDADGRPVPPPWDFGLAVQIRDINLDGHPDIYVCNDFQTPDHLWLGDGHGHFREAPLLAQRNMSYASMGVDFADLDRDGRLDFFTVEMRDPDLRQHLRTLNSLAPIPRHPGEYRSREDLPRNALYWNRGDGTYAEMAHFAGVAATSWSWTPVFLDVDLDGWEDLLVSNGHLHDVNNRDVTEQTAGKPGQNLQVTKDRLLHFPPLEPPKFAFRNRRDRTFEDVSAAWGFQSRHMAHGMITADRDDDGDLDVVANTLRGQPLVFRNDTTAPRVAVRVKGTGANRGGIGARVTLTGGPVSQTQEIVAGGQYLSHSQTLRTFAAGAGPMTLEVRWRSGRRSVVADVQANRVYEVDEAGATEAPPAAPTPPAKPVWFTDVSDRLNHVHPENAFNDFEQQPLLPQRYSQLGPGVAWGDANGDGVPDLALGAGKDGAPVVFLGDGRGGFSPARALAPVAEDTGTLLWLPSPAATSARLVASLANYESGGDPQATGALTWNQPATQPAPSDRWPANPASWGALAAADVDGDGHLEIFAAARLTARRWPQPGGSAWWRETDGRWVRDADASAPFQSVGPISDALLADLDGDGTPELILACELGPIRLLSRTNRAWREWQSGLRANALPALKPAMDRLTDLTGWWNSVAAADLDGDGRLDLIVGNRGRNTFWEDWGDHRPRIHWASVPDGSVAVLEGVEEAGGVRPIRHRLLLEPVLPDLKTRYPTHGQFAEATLPELLRGVPGVATLQAQTLASVVLLNRGDHFVALPLPAEAQWAPVFGIAPADYDGDGKTDLFLAQNLFAVRPDDSRLDAGRGLLLRGKGQGGFEPVPGPEAGIIRYGEQRGAAAADYDGDGRMDLVVTQNGAETGLFHNTGARPGLRVRLQGSAGNPSGIGAVVRPFRQEVGGPAQTITAGGGYWSQPDSTLVFAGAAPDQIEVLWPGGKRTRHPIAQHSKGVTLHPSGETRTDPPSL